MFNGQMGGAVAVALALGHGGGGLQTRGAFEVHFAEL